MLSVQRLCRTLGVSRSGYYAWAARVSGPPAGRAAADQELLAQIRAIHAQWASYGSPRVHAELLARRHRVGRHKVARLMRRAGITAVRGRVKSRPRAAPPRRRVEVTDQVHRRFTAPAPNRLWCTDVTMIRTAQGWLWAAVILDAFSRRVISWAVADRETPDTAVQALLEAIKIRRPDAGCVVHSDRGYQFSAWRWQTTLTGAGLVPSMGQRGSALDNAMIESWFSSLKSEAIYPLGQPATRSQARQLLFRHIVFHNNDRRHSALGYQAPATFENINQNLSA
jgi:putative transposase